MARGTETKIRAIVEPAPLAKSTQRGMEAGARMAKLNPQVDERGLLPLGNMMGKVKQDASEFDKSMEAANARVIAFAGATGIIFGLQRAFRALLTTTVEVQQTLIEIDVILQETSANLQRFGDELFTIARQTGQTFQVAANAAREFARQGLQTEEVLRRTADALTLVRQSGIDANRAVETFTAVINGFNREILTTTDILNRFIAVESQFAVAAGDLSDAVRVAGAVANDAGVNFNELIAIVTTARQITTRSGTEIGNAFRTIFTRIPRQRTLEALEDIGVAVRQADGEFQDSITVLQELANTYDTLSAAQRAQIEELVGGIFNINVLKAAVGDLTRDYSVYANALDVANNATDEAAKRNERLNQTIATQINDIRELSSQFLQFVGREGLVGPITRNLGIIRELLLEPLSNMIGQEEGEEQGFSFARGFARGVGEVLGGPLLVAATVAIGKLVMETLKFVQKNIAGFIGLNTKAKEHAHLQLQITEILSQQPHLYEQLINGAISRDQMEKSILATLRQQEQTRKRMGVITGGLAAGVMGRGGVRNFADPMQDAVGREMTALTNRGISPTKAKQSIFVGADPRVGIGVGNTFDEPSGRISQGVNREIRHGNDPRTAGVGNFARQLTLQELQSRQRELDFFREQLVRNPEQITGRIERKGFRPHQRSILEGTRAQDLASPGFDLPQSELKKLEKVQTRQARQAREAVQRQTTSTNPIPSSPALKESQGFEALRAAQQRRGMQPFSAVPFKGPLTASSVQRMPVDDFPRVQQKEGGMRRERFAQRAGLAGMGMAMAAGFAPEEFRAPLSGTGTGLLVGGMVGGPIGAGVGGGAMAAITSIGAAIQSIAPDLEELDERLQTLQATTKQTTTQTQEYIRAQQSLDEALERGDQVQVRQLSNEITDLIRDISDPDLRRALIGAAGDVGQLQEELSKFQREAQRELRLEEALAGFTRFEAESGRGRISRQALETEGFRGGLANLVSSLPVVGGSLERATSEDIEGLARQLATSVDVSTLLEGGRLEELEKVISGIGASVDDIDIQRVFEILDFPKDFKENLDLTEETKQGGEFAAVFRELSRNLRDATELTEAQRRAQEGREAIRSFNQQLLDLNRTMLDSVRITTLQEQAQRAVAIAQQEALLEIDARRLGGAARAAREEQISGQQLEAQFFERQARLAQESAEDLIGVIEEQDLQRFNPELTNRIMSQVQKDLSNGVVPSIDDLSKEVLDQLKEQGRDQRNVINAVKDVGRDFNLNAAELQTEFAKLAAENKIQSALQKELARQQTLQTGFAGQDPLDFVGADAEEVREVFGDFRELQKLMTARLEGRATPQDMAKEAVLLRDLGENIKDLGLEIGSGQQRFTDKQSAKQLGRNLTESFRPMIRGLRAEGPGATAQTAALQDFRASFERRDVEGMGEALSAFRETRDSSVDPFGAFQIAQQQTMETILRSLQRAEDVAEGDEGLPEQPKTLEQINKDGFDDLKKELDKLNKGETNIISPRLDVAANKLTTIAAIAQEERAMREREKLSSQTGEVKAANQELLEDITNLGNTIKQQREEGLRFQEKVSPEDREAFSTGLESFRNLQGVTDLTGAVTERSRELIKQATERFISSVSDMGIESEDATQALSAMTEDLGSPAIFDINKAIEEALEGADTVEDFFKDIRDDDVLQDFFRRLGKDLDKGDLGRDLTVALLPPGLTKQYHDLQQEIKENVQKLQSLQSEQSLVSGELTTYNEKLKEATDVVEDFAAALEEALDPSDDEPKPSKPRPPSDPPTTLEKSVNIIAERIADEMIGSPIEDRLKEIRQKTTPILVGGEVFEPETPETPLSPEPEETILSPEPKETILSPEPERGAIQVGEHPEDLSRRGSEIQRSLREFFDDRDRLEGALEDKEAAERRAERIAGYDISHLEGTDRTDRARQFADRISRAEQDIERHNIVIEEERRAREAPAEEFAQPFETDPNFVREQFRDIFQELGRVIEKFDGALEDRAIKISEDLAIRIDTQITDDGRIMFNDEKIEKMRDDFERRLQELKRRQENEKRKGEGRDPLPN